MAKKRLTKTQKLEQDLALYKEFLMQRDELVRKLQENGEYSFLNSPTYIQMQEKIRFLEGSAKLSEIGRVNAEGRWNRYSDYERKLHEDNKAFLEHEEDSEYFVGIIDCYRDLLEINKYKNEAATATGKIQGYKDIISERDAEIERLQKELAECQFNLATRFGEDDNVTVSDDIVRAQKSREDSYNLSKIAELEEQLAYYKNQLEKSEKDNEKLRDRVGVLRSENRPFKETLKNVRENKAVRDKSKGGRPAKITDEQRATVIELKRNGFTIREIAAEVGVSVGMVHRICKENGL